MTRETQTYSYFLRRVFRWYSKRFSTPLSDVEDLSLEEVLRHYYEETYEDMDDQHRELERVSLLETAEEREARQKRELEEDEEYVREVAEEVAAKRSRAEALKSLPAVLDPPGFTGVLPPVTGGKTAKPAIPPDIHVSFGDLADEV